MSTTPNAFSAAQIAERVDGTVRGRDDLEITGVNALRDARPHDITFITDARRAREWESSRAIAAVVAADAASSIPELPDRCLIIVPNAELALVRLLELFREPDTTLAPGIDATASVHPEASVASTASIGPHVSVGPGARIGERAHLHAGVRIYGNVSIGDGSIIHANTVIRERCTIGRNVLIHPNVSIGADGFGYRPAADGSGLVKMPHIGHVIIEDDVEIGAGSCVDRGKFGATVVGQGTKLDNLVQVAHNVRIGRNCVIAAVTGIAGSVTIGNWVRVAGCVGIADHVTIGDGASIAAMTGVTKSVPPGATWIGFPAEPSSEKLRQWAALRKLPALLAQRAPRREPGQPAGGQTGGIAPDSTHAPGS